MSIDEINRQKLHDAFVLANCHIGIWTNIEHFEYGTPRGPIEEFFKRIERVDERADICQALLNPEYVSLRFPN
jgi:hypothetical protein